jgi:hypothetical protein
MEVRPRRVPRHQAQARAEAARAWAGHLWCRREDYWPACNAWCRGNVESALVEHYEFQRKILADIVAQLKAK